MTTSLKNRDVIHIKELNKIKEPIPEGEEIDPTRAIYNRDKKHNFFYNENKNKPTGIRLVDKAAEQKVKDELLKHQKKWKCSLG